MHTASDGCCFSEDSNQKFQVGYQITNLLLYTVEGKRIHNIHILSLDVL